MKVVALLVIFLLIWRWTCSSALPCEDGNCGQTKKQQKNSLHLCNHAQFDDNINDITRSKRDTLTATLRQFFIDIGTKIHLVNKREITNSDLDQDNQENVRNRYFNTNGSFINVKDKLNSTSFNSKNSSKDASKEKRHVSTTIESKRSTSKPRNYTTKIGQYVRIERQASAIKNGTEETFKNITDAIYNSTKAKREIHAKINDTQPQSTTVFKTQNNGQSNTTGTQNTTTKTHVWGEQKQLNKFKRENNDTQSSHNTTRFNGQTTHIHNNDTHDSVNTTKAKRQAPHQNHSQNSQNMTRVHRETSHPHHNYTEPQSNTRVAGSTTHDHQNTIREGQNKTKVKRSSSNNTNSFLDAQNITRVKRKTFKVKNVTVNCHNTTHFIQPATKSVNRPSFDNNNYSKLARNTTKDKRALPQVLSHTHEEPANVKGEYQPVVLKNNTQDGHNKTIVKREAVDAKIDTKNDTQRAQNKTVGRRSDSMNCSHCASNKFIRQIRLTNNKTKETQLVSTSTKQNSTFRDEFQKSSKIKRYAPVFLEEPDTLMVISPFSSSENSTTITGSKRAFKPKCLTQILIKVLQENCTLKICNSSNETKQFDKSNKIKREIPDYSKPTKKGTSTLNTNGKLENTRDVENINIEIKNYREGKNETLQRQKREKSDDETVESDPEVETPPTNQNNITRRRRSTESSKNITIQIHRLMMNEIAKRKRSYVNITDTTSKKTSYVKEPAAFNVSTGNSTTNKNRRSSSIEVKTLNTPGRNETLQKNQTVSEVNPQSLETHFNKTSHQAEERSKKENNNRKFKRLASKNVDAEKSSNTTKNHRRTNRDVTEIQNSAAAESNFTAVNPEVAETEEAKQKRQHNTEFIRRKRSIDCAKNLEETNDAEQVQYARKRKALPEDQMLTFNNSKQENHTLIHQNLKRDTNEYNQNSSTPLNTTISKRHTNSRSVNNSIASKSMRKTRNDDKQSYIMKISGRAPKVAQNETRNNLTTSKNQRDSLRKPRSAVLNLASFEGNTMELARGNKTKYQISNKYVRKPRILTFSNAWPTKKNDTGKNTIEFNEISPNERKYVEENVSNKFFVNGVQKDYYRREQEELADDSSENLVGTNTDIFYVTAITGIGRSYFANEPYDAAESQEKFDEKLAEIDMEESTQTTERIRCSCATYPPNSTYEDGSFDERIFNIPWGKTESDKRMICINTCIEIIHVDLNFKREIYCSHVKTDAESLKEFDLLEQENIPEIFEIVFCQIFIRESEQTLKFILSWINVILLDVVVCLTGLGIVCVYLICFVSWRKRNNGPAYTSATYSVK